MPYKTNKRSIRNILQVALTVAVGLALMLPSSWISTPSFAAQNAVQSQVLSLSELEHGIADRLNRVEEFRFIEEEATKLGVRAYLFGGTAAGYAHYVKWDLQREKGDSRFQKDRFDYDYTNIYRSTQDLDIVIDGNPAQAQKLQNALQEKYPHLQGGKTAWEVRLLTQDMGDKQAILNNPDFMNQHTDSNSTGMIEITKPKNGEHVVRDVKDWNAKEPYFLKDVHDGMLHYYFSPLHDTTKFAREGRNPPILSAIRFLTKAFQYELKIRPEDLAHIKKIIQEFDPKQTAQNAYVAKWIEKNGKKLIQNAVNIEYAKNTLDQLGLREKLQAIKSDITVTDSLAWWMNKEPLRSQPVGQGTGNTARELGLDIVAHETNNFLAYESITRAHTGDPNVLISRQKAPGEVAAFGDGFYTKTGKEGARGTGLTIRFHLDPNTREGHDFNYVPAHDYVVVKNKSALKVIPESLDIDPVEYFKMLSESQGSGLQNSDRGILEKLKRRIGTKVKALTSQQEEAVLKIVQSAIQNSSNPENSNVIREWYSFPISTDHPKILEQLIRRKDSDRFIVRHIVSKPQWIAHPELIEMLIQNGNMDTDRAIASDVLSQPQWKSHPELIDKLIHNGKANASIVQHILSKPYWRDHPEWVENFIKNGTEHYTIAQSVLSRPEWSDRSDLVEKLLEAGEADGPIASSILSHHHWRGHPEWIEKLLERGKADGALVTGVLRDPYWQSYPKWSQWFATIMERGRADKALAESLFAMPHWEDHPEWVEKLVQRGKADYDLARHVFSKSHWSNHPEWVASLIKRGSASFTIVQYDLSNPHWKDHPELVEMIMEAGDVNHSHIGGYILSQPYWAEHPELVEKLIRSKEASDLTIKWKVLTKPHWRDHPELRRLAGGQEPTVENLRAAFDRGETVRISPKTCVIQHISESLH
jgi:hypothetical protein